MRKIRAVEQEAPFAASLDEAGALQLLQVKRQGRRRHAQLLGELVGV